MAVRTRVFTALHTLAGDLARRHEGHHDDEGEEDHEDTPEEIRARLDSWRNHAAATAFWYIILGLLLVILVVRLAHSFTPVRQLTRRLTSSRFFPHSVVNWWRHHPWPLSKSAIVLVYALLVALLIAVNAVEHDDTYLERLGFRAAWVSTTQPTLVFVLAARTNPVGLVLGTSYERVNWLHRWAGRVLLASVTVHASFFLAEWLPAGFLWTELRDVAIVKWGFGAWFVLLWTVASSVVPARRWRYEFFVAQHIGAAVALLALLFLHVPEHHHFSVWCAFVAFAYDVVTRAGNPVWRNVRLRLPAVVGARIPRYAFSADVEAVDKEATAVTIRDVSFKWTPGQHILIWSPTFPRQSPHPFTIANVANTKADTQDVHLLVKTKRGFTRELNAWAAVSQSQRRLRVLVAGPYGSGLFDWRRCTNLVLVSGSTGGSFVAAVLAGVLGTGDTGRLQSVTAVFVVRRRAHGMWYARQLASVLGTAKGLGISVNVEVAVTGGEAEVADLTTSRGVPVAGKDEAGEEEGLMAGEQEGEPLQEMERRWSSESEYGALKEEIEVGGADNDPLFDGIAAGLVKETRGRPGIDALIRREADRATGILGVAVCAGDSIEQATRRAVAAVSPSVSQLAGEERDIWLHIERAGG